MKRTMPVKVGHVRSDCRLAFGLLSWGYLMFSNVVDLCCTTFMLSLWSCFDTICIVKSAIWINVTWLDWAQRLEPHRVV